MNKTTACRDIAELTPAAQLACRAFLSGCAARGLKVLITETYRSQERQDWLYEQGRTRSGSIVTWTHKSRHTCRRAWDICQNVKGKEYSDSSFFKKCGEVAAELGIVWGGTWKSTPDTPHFEIPAIFDTNNLKNESEEIDMEELNRLKNEYAAYVAHTSEIIDTMGQEIAHLKEMMTLVGKDIQELKNR